MTDITKFVFKMVNVHRFAGKKLDCPYTIGEHSYRVACLSMFIVDQYNKENPNNPICMETALRKSLLHDLEETVTGDIPSPVKKYGNLRNELRLASECIMEDMILKNSPQPELYKKLWVEDKEGVAGEVIKVSDKLEGLLVCYYEVKRGNKYLEKPFISHVQWFESNEGKELLNKFSFAKNEYDKVKDYVTHKRESLLDKFVKRFFM